MDATRMAEVDEITENSPPSDQAEKIRPWRGIWAATRAALGALMGLAPHVMHHIGLLAGAAVLSGVFGNSVLYIVGLALSIPLLNRLRKRFNTWRAPLLGVLVFTALFALSTFVVGPLINPAGSVPTPEAPTVIDHEGHHE